MENKKKSKIIKKKYYQDMDKLRLLACICVLLYHFNILKGGYLAVCTFFVLSGYLSCISAFNKEKFSIIDYYKKRLLKIYLPLLTVVFATICVTYFFPKLSWLNLKPETTSVILGYNNFWQLSANLDYFARHVSSPFMHLWYIAILLQYDLFFPFIYLFLKKVGDKVHKIIPCVLPGLFGIISGLVFYYMSLTGNMMIPYYNTFTRIYSLLFGLSFGFIEGYYGSKIVKLPRMKKHNQKMFYGYLILLTILFILVDAKSVFFSLAMLFVSIISLRAIDYAKVYAKKDLSKKDKVIKSLASVSYEIYLWQYPVIYLFEHLTMSIYLKIPCMILLILVLSYLLHYCFVFEKKDKSKKMKIKKRLLKYFVRLCFIVITALGIYGFYLAIDHTIEMKNLEAELAENEKIIQKTQEEYAKRLQEEDASWQSLIDEMDVSEEGVKEAIKKLSVVGIGDSVMLGAVDNLNLTFPNGYFDAKVSRSIWVTNDILKELKNNNLLKEPIVLNLGANGDCSESCKKSILATCENREVFWLTVTNNDNVHVNEKLIELAKEYPNLHIIDWENISKGHDEYFYADGIHLTPDGKVAYTNAIYNAIYEVYFTKFEQEKQKLIESREEEIRLKIGFYGNDILLYAFENLQNDFPSAIYKIDKEYSFKSLKEEIQKQIDDNTLSNRLVFAFDKNLSLSLNEYEQLIDLCAGKQIYIVSANKKTNSFKDKLTRDNVTVLDFYNEMENHEEYLMKDNIHLTEEGNKALSDFLNILKNTDEEAKKEDNS